MTAPPIAQPVAPSREAVVRALEILARHGIVDGFNLPVLPGYTVAVDPDRVIAAMVEALNPDAAKSEVGRKAVARCIEIARETQEGFLSPEYATDQPMSSFNERFACEQVAEAIENEFGIGSDEQRRLLGKPTMGEEYRAALATPTAPSDQAVL